MKCVHKFSECSSRGRFARYIGDKKGGSKQILERSPVTMGLSFLVLGDQKIAHGDQVLR